MRQNLAIAFAAAITSFVLIGLGAIVSLEMVPGAASPPLETPPPLPSAHPIAALVRTVTPSAQNLELPPQAGIARQQAQFKLLATIPAAAYVPASSVVSQPVTASIAMVAPGPSNSPTYTTSTAISDDTNARVPSVSVEAAITSTIDTTSTLTLVGNKQPLAPNAKVQPRVATTVRKPVRGPAVRKPVVRRTIRKHVRPMGGGGATTPPSPGLDIPTNPSL